MYGYRHEAERSTKAANPETRNDVACFGSDPTNADLQQGGFGTNTETWRNRDEFGLSLEYWLDTSWGSHTFKAGYVQSDNDYTEDTRYTGADSALYRSIAIGDSGATFDEFTGAGWPGTPSTVAGTTPTIITAHKQSADPTAHIGLLQRH